MILTEIFLTGILSVLVLGSLSAQEYFTDDTPYKETEKNWEPFEKYLDSLSAEEREASYQEAVKRVRDYYVQKAEFLGIA